MARYLGSIVLGILLIAGCSEPKAEKKQSILKRTTQEVGKFDPNAGRKVSDSKVRVTNPLTGSLEAYGPIAEHAAKLGIDRQIAFFHAVNERYPTYEEFMSEIIKKNNFQLPVLPYKMEYQYDEENHKLVVVYPEEGTEEEKPQ